MEEHTDLGLIQLASKYVTRVGTVVLYSTIEGFEQYFIFMSDEEAKASLGVLQEIFAEQYRFLGDATFN